MSKTKNISLNISERLSALSILNGYKGNLDTLAIILEDIRKFTISDEEWKKANKEEVPNGDSVTWTWDNEKAGLKDIEIEKETANFICSDIEKKDKTGEFTLQDRPYITLRDKVKAVS